MESSVHRQHFFSFHDSVNQFSRMKFDCCHRKSRNVFIRNFFDDLNFIHQFSQSGSQYDSDFGIFDSFDFEDVGCAFYLFVGHNDYMIHPSIRNRRLMLLRVTVCKYKTKRQMVILSSEERAYRRINIRRNLLHILLIIFQQSIMRQSQSISSMDVHENKIQIHNPVLFESSS
jgi:hypothetical protein